MALNRSDKSRILRRYSLGMTRNSEMSTEPSITTTLPQFSQFMAGNRLTEGKATKLSIAWAGRHEEVLKVLFFRTVVVILN